jgi:hypothetical protein
MASTAEKMAGSEGRGVERGTRKVSKEWCHARIVIDTVWMQVGGLAALYCWVYADCEGWVSARAVSRFLCSVQGR